MFEALSANEKEVDRLRYEVFRLAKQNLQRQKENQAESKTVRRAVSSGYSRIIDEKIALEIATIRSTGKILKALCVLAVEADPGDMGEWAAFFEEGG